MGDTVRDRLRDGSVQVASLLVGLLGLALVAAMVLGAATYDEGPPPLGREAIEAMADMGFVVVPDEEATREHVDDARVLAARHSSHSDSEMSLAHVTEPRTGEDHGLTWVVYDGRVEQKCFGGDMCGPGPHYGRGWAFFDPATLRGTRSGAG